MRMRGLKVRGGDLSWDFSRLQLMRMRGLKEETDNGIYYALELQLMRMRGLKAYMPMQTGNFIQVATHAYAWLEGRSAGIP